MSIKLNAFLNILKSCCNILIPIITYPYISRTLGASNYGKYSFAESIISIFSIFASLGIPTYAVREGARMRNNKEKLERFSTEIFSINIIALGIVLLLLFIITLFVPRLHQDIILVYLLSLNIITNILSRDWINTIYEDFLWITIRYIMFQILGMVMLFLFVKRTEDYYLYALTVVLSNAGGYLINFFYTQKYISLKITLHANLRDHIKPIFYLFGVTLAIQVYIKSDIAILGFLRPDRDVGIYTLSSRIYTVIKTLLNAIIMVAVPRASKYIGDNNVEAYQNILKQLQKYLYIMVFPCVVGMFFESQNIMRLIGGPEFVSGTNVLQILCIAMIFAVFGCFYAQAVLVPNRLDKYFFIATFISAIENIVLNIILIPFWGIEGAAVTTLMAEGTVIIMCCRFSRKIYFRDIRKDIWPPTIGCIFIGAICLLINRISVEYYIQLILAISASTILYFGSLLMMKDDIAIEFVSNVLSKCHKK